MEPIQKSVVARYWSLGYSNGTHLRGAPVLDRVLYRLEKAGVDILDDSACWPWPGARNSAGYGRMGRDATGDTYVHRIMYREANGEIPPEHDVDHLCRNRPCVNPKHLEAVSLPENARRRRRDVLGQKCAAGLHDYEPHLNGERGCRRCYNAYMREYNRAYRARRTASGSPVR